MWGFNVRFYSLKKRIYFNSCDRYNSYKSFKCYRKFETKNSMINIKDIKVETSGEYTKPLILTQYFSKNIILTISPNIFKKQFITDYNSNLHLVLKTDRIVSVYFTVKFENNSYRTLGSRFGFKFNYDELTNWNFVRSIYFETLYYHFNNYYLVYNGTDEYKKLLIQFDYKFSNHKAPLNIDQLFTRFAGYLMDLLEDYQSENIEYFGITYSSIKNVDHSKPLKNINTIPFKKGISNLKNIKKAFSNSILPLSLDENYYGKRTYSTRTYVDGDIKRVVTDLSTNKTKKDVYSIKTNLLLESFIDTKIDETTFIRYNLHKKVSVTIRNNNIIRSTLITKLPLIKPFPNKPKNTFNKHIGSFDLEVYYNSITKKNEVYALGFAYGGNNVLVSEPDVKMYYLEKGSSSEEIVLNCINEMLSSKYKRAIFYTHNLGGYDIVFILKILSEYNKKVGGTYYKFKAVFREKKVLKLHISSQKSKSVSNTIILVDSLALLPMSLAKLSKDFSTKYEKGLFPYKFVTDKTLYYIGLTPSIEYYQSIKQDISYFDYKKIVKPDWDLKESTLKYLKTDLISLLQIIFEFSQYIFDKYGVQVSESLTITGIAVNIFLNHHKPKNKNLGLLNISSIYNDIKKAYYGGLSEVYRGYGENLYYYDVNSLYPYAALNDMPGNECTYLETHDENEYLDINKDKLFGFFYCDVKTTKDYFGLLPYRDKQLLTYPIGNFSGWFFSPHIEFAQKNGYDIKIRKGYNFNRVTNVFDKFIQTIYKEKQESSGSKRLISKLLLNSLLGRFGMHIDKRVTSLINSQEEFREIITEYEVFDEEIISDDLILCTHSGEVSSAVCEQHGKNYIDVLNKKNRVIEKSEYNSIRNVSIGISAAVTSYSSIFMLKIKQDILSKGGKIYYTDTDSIITDIELPKIGNDLGQFKLEHKIIRGYFISSKLYCLVVWDEKNKKEKCVIKSKGVLSSNLNEIDFKKLLNNEIINHGAKVSSKKNYPEGFVSIDEKLDINLNPMSYRKRIKIFDDQNNWVDTSPLKIECYSSNNDENL